ncbi:MAG: calcium/sodium antiporter [Erysipelotrichaceae bacterium]|nr:calcium/sodium antiporter [Erysipelotrichaceae bacterium]
MFNSYIIKAVVLFVIGLICLIKGGDYFVDGATGIAKKFHVPEILIGATIVSIGTTLPEVMVSANGALKGVSAISYGNAIGSIICNTALIAAVTIAVAPALINKKELYVPVSFFFVSAAIFALNAYIFKGFSRITGIIFLVIFVVYIALQLKDALSNKNKPQEDDEEEEKPLSKNIILLLIGAALIAIGADLLVDNGIIIANALGVPESVIALTFVALGTSLPELVTAITSLAKGHGSLSLGNVIGANLFNIVLVSGISITLAPFSIPSAKTLFGMNASLLVDIPVMLAVMGILTVPALLNGKLKRSQGISLLVIYFAFIIFQLFI